MVENAVKHGISKREAGGTVKISAAEKEGHLHIEVSDDGAGTSVSRLEDILKQPQKTEEEGVGLRNINQRLVHLFGAKYGLRFTSHPNQGTSVHVQIPIKAENGRK